MATKKVLLDLGVGDVHTPSSMGTAASPEPGALAQAALCVVHNDVGDILAVSRPEQPHEMSIPGGMVESGEAASAAAIREVAEETGITVVGVEHLLDTTSPVDGRAVSIFRATKWSGEASALEGGRVAWLPFTDLVAQAVHYRPTLTEIMPLLQPEGETARRRALVDAAKREALANAKFAIPAKRKLPIDTAARTRNAAARLSGMKARGQVTDAEFTEAKTRIAAAAKTFGIASEFNASAPRKRPAGRGRGSIHIRADLAPGGALHVRHMTTNDDGSQAFVQLSDGTIALRDVRPIRKGDEVDPADAGVTLMGKPAWKDGTAKKLVWIQLAECGAWKGHPSGPFQMTPTTFSEIVKNFERRGLPVPFDMEHASEQDATSGSIPVFGAPAPGWAHRLDNRGIGGLWGLVEWLDYARTCIQEGSIGFLSPAIRFGCKDPVTGAGIGARLTSVALTNQPFLTHLDDLRAAKDAAGKSAVLEKSYLFRTGFGEDVRLARGALLERMVHAPSAVLPRLKQALKAHPLANLDDLSGHIGKLREACMSAGPDGSYCGENLSDYLGPLTDLVSPGLGATYMDVLDALDAFVDAEIEKHVNQGVPMPDPPSASMDDIDGGGGSEEMTMSEKTAVTDLETKLAKVEGECTKLLSDKTTLDGEKTALVADKAQLLADKTKLEADKTKLETDNSTLTMQMRDVTARADVAEATVTALKAVLVLKDGEKLEEAAKRFVDGHATLLKDKSDRDEQDLAAAVETAYLTYKDTKKLAETDKPHMLRIAKADREAFNGLYPPVGPAERHLLRTVTPPEERPVVASVESSDPVAIMRATGCTYAEALSRASQKTVE